MSDVRSTTFAVFTLFAMLNLAKCDLTRAFSFHPERANAPTLASVERP